jgi:hypothetical protein
MAVTFEELPPHQRSKTDPTKLKYAAEAAELVANPGNWAKIKEFDNVPAAGAFAFNIRHGKLRAFAGGGFEATIRGNVVYARFVTKEEENNV